MKTLITFLCCLLITQMSAETIRNVEYYLPQNAQDWQIGNKLENEKGTTIVYIPNGSHGQETHEFFGVNANHQPLDINDTASLKAALSKTFPNIDIDIQVLEKSNSGTIYEWTAKENGKELAHGWVRSFAANGGTVVMSYQTGNIDDVHNARDTWLPALKNARLK